MIVLLALLCSLPSGSSGHNAAVVELCFNGGVPPSNMPAEYAACIKDMQDSFALLDGFIEDINKMTEAEIMIHGTYRKCPLSKIKLLFPAGQQAARTMAAENE